MGFGKVRTTVEVQPTRGHAPQYILVALCTWRIQGGGWGGQRSASQGHLGTHGEWSRVFPLLKASVPVTYGRIHVSEDAHMSL